MISPGQIGTCNGAGQNGTPSDTAAPVGRGSMLVSAPDSAITAVELNDLAQELGSAFGRMVNFYRGHYRLSAEEAVARADEATPEYMDHILNAPPDQVSWFDLDTLAQKDEAKALERWEQIKQAARNEIRSGYRAARTIEGSGGPWERARFLAVRAELTEAWKPNNAGEQLLVDQLAQWQVLLWRWQETVAIWTSFATHRTQRAKKGEPYEAIRLSDEEAMERATVKVERLHHLYLRTLKALQDQRRPRPPVVVRHAEQVSIDPDRVSVDNLFLPTGFSKPMNIADIEVR